MANFMKFVDHKPEAEKDKQLEDQWQMGSDDTEPEPAKVSR